MANELTFDVVAKLDKAEKDLAAFKSEQTKDFGKLSDLISDSFGGGAVQKGISLIKQFGPAAAAAVLSFESVKTAIDAAFEGEKINAINASFEILTKNVGAAGTELKEKLVSAAQGLVESTELISAANKGLVELGKNFDALPETLALATKASQVFGGTVVQNFELLNQAVASGNTRVLRHLGIIIDSEKAYRKFAEANGVAANALTEAGRKQAILNEVLEKGKTVFEGVDPNINKLGAASTRLSVSIKELTEAVTLLISKNTAGFFASLAEGATNVVKSITTNIAALGTGTEATAAKLKLLNIELESTQRTIVGLEARKAFDPLSIETLDFAKKKLEDTRLQLELLNEEQRKSNSQAAARAATTETPAAIDPEKLFNLAQVESARANLRVKLDQTRLDIIENQNKTTDEQTAAILEGAAKIQLVEDQAFAAKKVLEVQKITADRESRRLINEEIILLEQDKNAKIAELQRKADIVSVNLSKAFQQATVQVISSSITTMVGNLARGANAFEGFGKKILGLLGDLAIQTGTVILATGIGMQSFGDLTGTSAVIAGAGLIAVGALLKAFSGSGGEAGTAGGGVAGGIGGGFTPVGQEPVTQGFLESRAGQGTQVNVNIQGNVLDRRGTGLEIAEVIQEHFNNNGQVLASGGF